MLQGQIAVSTCQYKTLTPHPNSNSKATTAAGEQGHTLTARIYENATLLHF